MRVRIGCELTYHSNAPTPALIMVEARQQSGYHRLVRDVGGLEPTPPSHHYTDRFGNTVWRLLTPEGPLRVHYDALADVPPEGDPVKPGLAKVPVAELPDDVLIYTLPSRYCHIDQFIDEAWDRFGAIRGGWEQAQAVCSHVHQSLRYEASSDAFTAAHTAYQSGSGVCRDFAHTAVAFCRALNLPARYVSGYLPDIDFTPTPGPMDFHAWTEVYLEGGWYAFDPRHDQHRTGRVLSAYGRDAVDVSFATFYGGTQMRGMKVWADQVDDNAVL
ncbi:MAG: transglutaminase family protein [Trueperaceae bacterium]|nr:transglutaminase family protein [Trueperaceae bacterium]